MHLEGNCIARLRVKCAPRDKKTRSSRRFAFAKRVTHCAGDVLFSACNVEPLLVSETPDFGDVGKTCPSSVALHFPELGYPLCADEEVLFVEEMDDFVEEVGS